MNSLYYWFATNQVFECGLKNINKIDKINIVNNLKYMICHWLESNSSLFVSMKWIYLQEHQSLQVTGSNGWVVADGGHMLRGHHQRAHPGPRLLRQHSPQNLPHKGPKEERIIKENIQFKDMCGFWWTIVFVAKKAKPWDKVSKKEYTE